MPWRNDSHHEHKGEIIAFYNPFWTKFSNSNVYERISIFNALQVR